MNLKILSSLFFTLVIVSCAKPNWKNTEDNPTSPQAQLPQKPTDSESTTITECKYPLISQNMCVYLTWKVMPSSDSYGEFELYLKPIKSNTATSETENLNLTNKIISDLSVILWMPSMGHGSVPVNFTVISENTIQVSHVFFIMPGEWEIRIQLKKDSQKIYDQIIFPFNF